MASIGVVNAVSTSKKTPSETNNRPKKFYFGVLFDGTGAGNFLMMLGKDLHPDRMFKKLDNVPNHEEIEEDINVL